MNAKIEPCPGDFVLLNDGRIAMVHYTSTVDGVDVVLLPDGYTEDVDLSTVRVLDTNDSIDETRISNEDWYQAAVVASKLMRLRLNKQREAEQSLREVRQERDNQVKRIFDLQAQCGLVVKDVVLQAAEYISDHGEKDSKWLYPENMRAVRIEATGLMHHMCEVAKMDIEEVNDHLDKVGK